MAFKICAGIVAAALLLIFVSPVVLKLNDLSLSVVVLIGIVLMGRDLWESLRHKDD